MRILTVTLLIRFNYYPYWTSLVAQTVKHLPTMRETCREVLLEKEMATHSSILAWRIPWMEELGRLQSMGSQRVGHSWVTSLHITSITLIGGSDGKASACSVGDLGSIPGLGRSPGEGNGNPFQYSCLENSMDRGAWHAPVHGVTKNQTRLRG